MSLDQSIPGLAALRAQLGYNQSEFADLIGVSRLTVSRMERGIAVHRTTVLATMFALGMDFPQPQASTTVSAPRCDA